MSDESTLAKKPLKGSVSLPIKRMTPSEFKDEVKRRGWTYRLLAERWGFTPNWISKTARNADRALHFDDAVRGLPLLLAKPRK